MEAAVTGAGGAAGGRLAEGPHAAESSLRLRGASGVASVLGYRGFGEAPPEESAARLVRQFRGRLHARAALGPSDQGVRVGEAPPVRRPEAEGLHARESLGPSVEGAPAGEAPHVGRPEAERHAEGQASPARRELRSWLAAEPEALVSVRDPADAGGDAPQAQSGYTGARPSPERAAAAAGFFAPSLMSPSRVDREAAAAQIDSPWMRRLYEQRFGLDPAPAAPVMRNQSPAGRGLDGQQQGISACAAGRWAAVHPVMRSPARPPGEERLVLSPAQRRGGVLSAEQPGRGAHPTAAWAEAERVGLRILRMAEDGQGPQHAGLSASAELNRRRQALSEERRAQESFRRGLDHGGAVFGAAPAGEPTLGTVLDIVSSESDGSGGPSERGAPQVSAADAAAAAAATFGAVLESYQEDTDHDSADQGFGSSVSRDTSPIVSVLSDPESGSEAPASGTSSGGAHQAELSDSAARATGTAQPPRDQLGDAPVSAFRRPATRRAAHEAWAPQQGASGHRSAAGEEAEFADEPGMGNRRPITRRGGHPHWPSEPPVSGQHSAAEEAREAAAAAQPERRVRSTEEAPGAGAAALLAMSSGGGRLLREAAEALRRVAPHTGPTANSPAPGAPRATAAAVMAGTAVVAAAADGPTADLHVVVDLTLVRIYEGPCIGYSIWDRGIRHTLYPNMIYLTLVSIYKTTQRLIRL